MVVLIIRIYHEPASEAAHQRQNFVEQLCAVLGNETPPEMLGMFPQDLDWIGLRAIRRKIVQIQAISCSFELLLVYRGLLFMPALSIKTIRGTHLAERQPVQRTR